MEISMTRRTKGSLAILLLSVAVWAGCAVGPNYKRPTVDVPVTYRGAISEEPAISEQGVKSPTQKQNTASLGDEKWWDVFQDDELRNLIRTALKNNYDVRIAAARVLEAQAQLGVTSVLLRGKPRAGHSVGRMESGFLGTIPSGHRGGTSYSAGQRVGPEAGHGNSCCQCRRRLFSASATRSSVGDFQANAGFPERVPEVNANAPSPPVPDWPMHSRESM
jgi:hypothetical protein